MKIGFFEESENVKSSMRLYSFIALLAAIAMCFYAMASNQLDANVITTVSMFLIAAFAPKTVQKFAEKPK